MTSVIGIIGGSGFYTLSEQSRPEQVNTPFSELSVTLHRESIVDKTVLFLPRHGASHGIPPHKINYRANVYALMEAGAEAIISVNVVGGITTGMTPGTLVIPDQLIDYTWGREHTYFDSLGTAENHIDFTWPYDETMRGALWQAAIALSLPCRDKGVYGCTQGPRLETAAEIQKLFKDGCDIVGMTGMPEAALARELAVPYASIALVVNRAAGLDGDSIAFADIMSTLDTGIAEIRKLLLATLDRLD